MNGYQPAPGVWVGRAPCLNCGAAYRLHRTPGWEGTCPEAYRPAGIAEAEREMVLAERSGDEARIFIARGNLQRLVGR
jgi:hypothetical protein